jgi:hypothetical protein
MEKLGLKIVQFQSKMFFNFRRFGLVELYANIGDDSFQTGLKISR